MGHLSIRGSNVITFRARDNDKSLYPIIERSQGLRSAMQTLKSSSTSCFKYLANFYCCKIYLLHSHLKFYLSLGKTLKKLSVDHVVLKNVKYKLMFSKAYLEPSQVSMIKPFCEIS